MHKSNLCNELTQIFMHLITNPSMLLIDSHSMRMIERFTVIQYDPICAATGVNEASRIMFTPKLKPLEQIPPTQLPSFIMLSELLSLANYYYWSLSLQKETLILPPADYGCLRNERLKSWMPQWSDLPEVSKACSLLVSCHRGCKQCRCTKNL